MSNDFDNLQDLTEATLKDATEYGKKLEKQMAEIKSLAAQQTEEIGKALQEEKEKREKTAGDLDSLIKHFDDLTRQFRAHLVTVKEDEDMPYPQQVRRHPPSPSVQAFSVGTQTDDEGGPVDRYTRMHAHTHTHTQHTQHTHTQTHNTQHTHTHTHTHLCMPQQKAHNITRTHIRSSCLRYSTVVSRIPDVQYCTTHSHMHTTNTHYRDNSDEDPNRVSATEENPSNYKKMAMGAQQPRGSSFPPVRNSPITASGFDVSLLDDASASMKLPQLNLQKTTSSSESSSTTSLAQAKVKKRSKKSGRRGRR